jgi:hypothetical protein
MARVPKAARLVSPLSCLFLLAGCGLVYTRITQSYQNKEVLSQAQAVQVIEEFTGAAVDENEITVPINVVDSTQTSFSPSNGFTQTKTTEIFYHNEQKTLKFADVWGIQTHGVVDTPGNLTVTLFDKNGNALVGWTFHGSLDAEYFPGVATNSSENDRRFLSGLLVLCPNVQ